MSYWEGPEGKPAVHTCTVYTPIGDEGCTSIGDEG